MNVMAQWEDESNNRQIQFSIAYTVENSTVKVDCVTPIKVTFIDPVSNTAVRSIGVHTSKGRNLLVQQFAQSGKLDEFVNEIAQRNGLLVSV